MIFHRPLSLRSKDTSHPTRSYKYYLHTVLYFYVVSSSSRVVCCSVTHFYGMRVCCVGRSWSLHYVWFLSLFLYVTTIFGWKKTRMYRRLNFCKCWWERKWNRFKLNLWELFVHCLRSTVVRDNWILGNVKCN